MNRNITFRSGRGCALLGAALLAVAMTAPQLQARRTSDRGPVRFKEGAQVDVGKRSLMVHDVGNVRMSLSNWGEQGNPDGVPGYYGFEFPLGSGNDFLFSSGIWVGAIVNGQKFVSTGTDGDNGTNEFAPFLSSVAPYLNSFYPLSAISELVNGRATVRGAKGVDDDNDGRIDEDPAGDRTNDLMDEAFVHGAYNDDGDEKLDEDGDARGTQEYFTVYDDRYVGQVQSSDPDGHTPLNILVTQRTYAWGEAYASEFILVDLVVRNIGELPLTEVYVGLFADADIVAKGESGDAASADDWNFYDAPNLMMVQGDDTTDADGFGPGLFAMKIVRTPKPLDSLKISFSNFERLGGGDPETNIDKYNLLNPGPNGVIMPPASFLSDWRYLLGFGPKEGSWVLRPGESLPVTVAFIAGTRLEDLRRNAQWAQAIYDNDFQGPQAPDQPRFSLQPSTDRIRITWESNAETSQDPISKDFDFEGYVIQRSSDAVNWFTLTQFDKINPNDEFDPEFRRENLNLGMPYDSIRFGDAGLGWTGTLDTVFAGTDSAHVVLRGNYWLEDRDVLRGWNYFYIVRAFDKGVSGAGVLITPVGRSYLEAAATNTLSTWPYGEDLERVIVVPNPYQGGHQLESSGALDASGVKRYPRKLYFMNLPPTGARIDVYSLAGDHIITLEHPPGGSDQLVWDMRNKYQQEIVSGVYLYVVESGRFYYSGGRRWIEGSGQTKIDKFVVLK
ncbi:MAG: hypothetical protein FJY67_01370 [Calditrichaeota bacterium]|nr:hypothetical protein [Calditrichota bacterium]